MNVSKCLILYRYIYILSFVVFIHDSLRYVHGGGPIPSTVTGHKSGSVKTVPVMCMTVSEWHKIENDGDPWQPTCWLQMAHNDDDIYSLDVQKFFDSVPDSKTWTKEGLNKIV